MTEENEMYRCQGPPSCGYIYNPKRGDKKRGIAKGTEFKELPDDWSCPSCGLPKRMFKPMSGMQEEKSD
jgi:rubredoxin